MFSCSMDTLLFECDFIKPSVYTSKLEDDPALPKLLLHSALDAFEVARWQTPSEWLGIIDQYGEWLIAGHLGLPGERLLLLFDSV